MRLKGVKTAVVALLLAFQGPVVLATEADSLRTDSERFAWQQLVAPTVLFSAGAVGVKSEWFRTRINEPVRDYAARIRGENAIQFEDYIQYAPGAAYLGLGFAVMTALLRVYHERHWVNDVLGGAAVGILSAQAAYWLLPAERRLSGLENKDLSLLAVPYTDGRFTGLSLAMRF